jgi:hypothetical protein
VDTRNPAAVALSKLGASKGGKARAKALTKERRSEIAKSAAKKRWGAKRMDPKDPDYVKRVAALGGDPDYLNQIRSADRFLEMLPRHRGCNRLGCDFDGFLDYLLRFNDGCGTGSHAHS